MRRLLNHPRLRTHASQAGKFIVCGLSGALIDFLIIYFLVEHNHLDPRVAYIPSGFITVVFVFFFNKYVTFGNRESDKLAQTMRFALVYGSAFFINYAIASGTYSVGLFFLASLHMPNRWVLVALRLLPYLARAFAIGVTAIWNYCFSHSFVFKKRV